MSATRTSRVLLTDARRRARGSGPPGGGLLRRPVSVGSAAGFAELTDVVTELLMPLADREGDVDRGLLADYRRTTLTPGGP